MKIISSPLLAGLFLSSFLSVANAAVYTETAGETTVTRGAFYSRAVHLAFSRSWKLKDSSWQIRSIGNGVTSDDAIYNYHIFSVPKLPAGEVIVDVTFGFTHPTRGNAYTSPDPSEIIGLFDIDPANFGAIGAPRVDIGLAPPGYDAADMFAVIDDLAGGTKYGEFTVTAANTGKRQNVSLPGMIAKLTEIGQAGGSIGISGVVLSNTHTGFGVEERVLRGSSSQQAVSTLTITTSSASAEPILTFEEPVSGEVSNGIANVRGWVVSEMPVANVDLYIDGVLFGEIPYGGARPLVGDMHSNFPNSDKSGFSMAYGFSNLSPGSHTMRVKAFDDSHQLLAEKINNFTVAAFVKPYIGRSDIVDLTAATLGSEADSTQFYINNAVLDGVTYNLVFGWNAPTQKFEMVNITQATSQSQAALLAQPFLETSDMPAWSVLDTFTSVSSAMTGSTILGFEEPIDDGVSNGIANVRGWVVSDTPVAKVDLYIDDTLLGEIPYGGARPLVGDMHSNFPNSDKSGFSMAYGFSNLSPGPHTMQVKAFDDSNQLLAEKTNNFTVTAFASSYIAANAFIDFSAAIFTGPQSGQPLNQFRIDNVGVGGVIYKLLFEWRSATQKFEMIEITRQ